MNVTVDLDNSCTEQWVPPVDKMERWLNNAAQHLGNSHGACVLSVRIVDQEEAAELNQRYRGINQPTNILSFDSSVPGPVLDSLGALPLGDLVICAPLVAAEATDQGKSAEAHWAHLLLHGFLHLNGYQHDAPDKAEEMESLETQLMSGLGFPNPYLSN